MEEKKCIFCEIIAGNFGTKFVFEDESCVAFKDINPRAPHHVLFVPKIHIPKVSDVKDKDELLLGHLLNTARKYAKKIGVEDYRLQFNCGEKGGQEIFHIHLHLLGWT
jgi:histidine triad (HIT) family protein